MVIKTNSLLKLYFSDIAISQLCRFSGFGPVMRAAVACTRTPVQQLQI